MKYRYNGFPLHLSVCNVCLSGSCHKMQHNLVNGKVILKIMDAFKAVQTAILLESCLYGIFGFSYM